MLTEGISVATTVTIVFKKKKSRLPIYLTLAWGKCIIIVFKKKSRLPIYLTLAWGKCIIIVFLFDFVSLSCLT